MLLVDELVVGMMDVEIVEIVEFLKEIVKDYFVVVVEYDMDFVCVFGVKVIVFYEGLVLVEGFFDYVFVDEWVVEVYLG